MKKDILTVVITGGTGGIGYYSALAAAQNGWRVVITGRDTERGELAKARIVKKSGNANVVFVVGDLSSISGVQELVQHLHQCIDVIDILVNNAGYLGNEDQKSIDGVEMHFAVNVLSPWLLSQMLLPMLKKSGRARVLNITGGDKPAAIDPKNLQAEKGFKGLMTYTHSKSIMEAMSVSLSKEFEREGVSVNIVFPGRASTVMTRSLSLSGLPGAMKLMLPFFRFFFRDDGGKSAKNAASSTIWAMKTAELDGVTGRYFDTHFQERPLHSTAYDLETQKAITKLLQALCSSVLLASE